MISRVCRLIRMKLPAVDTVGLLIASGDDVPSDGESGYQTGCLWQKTNGGANTSLYVNEGSETSCDFNAK